MTIDEALRAAYDCGCGEPAIEARLRQLGNAVIPRQAAVVLSRLLTMAHAAETPAQGELL